MRELRAYVLIDRLQPQFAAYVGATVKGDVPVAGMAELLVEMAPGNEVYSVADAALKAADVKPASQVIEREFGFLELHAFDQSAVKAAGAAILGYLGLEESDRLRPKVVSSQVVTNVDPYQAQLINKMRRGSLVVPGQTYCVLEVSPAAYASYAMNEAEKSATINVVYAASVGRFGRVFFSGNEAETVTARDMCVQAVQTLGGRDW